MRNKIECCVLCGERQFEVLTRFVNGPQAGDAQRIGKPEDSALRARLVLMSGRMVDVTLCRGCLPGISQRMPDLWRAVLEAFAFERQLRTLTAKQAEAQDAEITRLASDVPLGVLASGPFAEAA
jgi:hypothetical protein